MSNSALTFANVADSIGKEIGVSSWVTVDQNRINAFADCTNDHQWIHVDVERAKKESPFGTTIAHGYLTLSLLADMSYEIGIVPEDVAAVFNYGLDKVRFLTPVKSGSRVRARATLTDVTEQAGGRKLLKVTNSIEIEGETKPALIAETLAVLVGQP
ncbi:MAG: MaoC family dehydratase [Rhodocyclaceae bacterium]|nr:MaoC family dehydratase [Rhodocyclaceae bacterium]MBK9623203.1 MaoC family dehydratase [Rhodocyclaceae bacterium]MBL0075727.1 MaoC family dehydratase [Rhodocyclaceae bacterium]MBP6110673.1 MaoC family dehydratase [Rhodocyclaceae bacterium]